MLIQTECEPRNFTIELPVHDKPTKMVCQCNGKHGYTCTGHGYKCTRQACTTLCVDVERTTVTTNPYRSYATITPMEINYCMACAKKERRPYKFVRRLDADRVGKQLDAEARMDRKALCNKIYREATSPLPAHTLVQLKERYHLDIVHARMGVEVIQEYEVSFSVWPKRLTVLGQDVDTAPSVHEYFDTTPLREYWHYRLNNKL